MTLNTEKSSHLQYLCNSTKNKYWISVEVIIILSSSSLKIGTFELFLIVRVEQILFNNVRFSSLFFISIFNISLRRKPNSALASSALVIKGASVISDSVCSADNTSVDRTYVQYPNTYVTRDYINNYVCNRLMHVCMYQVIELYDYIVLCVTHATLVSEADSYLPRTATN